MIHGSLSGNQTFFVVFPTAFTNYMKICRYSVGEGEGGQSGAGRGGQLAGREVSCGKVNARKICYTESIFLNIFF